MPKPGKFGNKPSWKAQYNEHDYRSGNEPPRRVSFKPNRGNKKNKDWTIRAHLQDEDIDMGTSTSDGRVFNRRFKGGKKGGRSDSPVPGKRRLIEGPIGWYKIILPYGNKYEKDFILRTLMEKIEPCPLWPIMDGVVLPPPISFDIVEEIKLPIKCQTFLCNPNGENVVREFLKQYFLIYDQDNSRSQLLQAYHENAVFSLTTCYPYGQNKDRNLNWLNWYTSESRNLLRVTDSDRRMKLLKQGNVDIVAFLHEMPLTKHDMNSFTVDLVLYTPQMLVLSISGLFKELKSGHKTPPTRSFFKTLIIVPVGQGFCIINDALHVTNATEEQLKTAFKLNTATITTPSAPSVSNTSPSTSVVDETTKQQMVVTLSQQTGMNLEWSGKCLAETQWDFQRALSVFTEFQQKGVIPAEAFIK